jgi:hypothetical protein
MIIVNKMMAEAQTMQCENENLEGTQADIDACIE